MCSICKYIFVKKKKSIFLLIYPQKNYFQSNNQVEIITFGNNTGYELQPTHSLRAHTRVITGLNWHPKEPDIIATCSIDTFIHVWDLRDVRKPCLSFSAVGKKKNFFLTNNLYQVRH